MFPKSTRIITSINTDAGGGEGRGSHWEPMTSTRVEAGSEVSGKG